MIIDRLKGKSFRGRSLTLFLARLPEIKEAIAGGYTKTVIWKALREAALFDAGYAQFSLYVRRYVDPKTKPAAPFKLKPGVNSVDQSGPPKTLPANPSYTQFQPRLNTTREATPCPTAEKPRKPFSFTTIGKEHLMEPYKSDVKEQK